MSTNKDGTAYRGAATGGGSLDIRENSEKPALGEPAARTQRSCAPTLHLSTCFRCFFKSLALPARP